MTERLSLRLRAGTAELHRQVERAGVMPVLLRGALPAPVYRRLYCALLRNLHAIYASLEAGLARHAAHPALAPLALPGLARSARIVQDLALLDGPAWVALPLAGAAQEYADRLRALDADAPALLAAHAYVRYLGDVSGGQVVRKVVRRALALPADDRAGTRFYDFDDMPGGAACLAAQLRAALDAIPATAVAPDALVAEACAGFRRHAALFAELQPLLPAGDGDGVVLAD